MSYYSPHIFYSPTLNQIDISTRAYSFTAATAALGTAALAAAALMYKVRNHPNHRRRRIAGAAALAAAALAYRPNHRRASTAAALAITTATTAALVEPPLKYCVVGKAEESQ